MMMYVYQGSRCPGGSGPVGRLCILSDWGRAQNGKSSAGRERMRIRILGVDVPKSVLQDLWALDRVP
jgi:hypothetical protein